ncbi:hypothetical protein FA15DRAFT_754658 [Coprinopsis marcescibilis]|uniref:Uncharacterized protein n=1 Tax=Coprinopsis marcescibilis TaxID=230819 RepID=A0A5C3LEQ9_COPMA|nr:hypothetical protein FA15DRAFT_754658 [Coprinopsis marcescibilis]
MAQRQHSTNYSSTFIPSQPKRNAFASASNTNLVSHSINTHNNYSVSPGRQSMGSYPTGSPALGVAASPQPPTAASTSNSGMSSFRALRSLLPFGANKDANANGAHATSSPGGTTRSSSFGFGSVRKSMSMARERKGSLTKGSGNGELAPVMAIERSRSDSQVVDPPIRRSASLSRLDYQPFEASTPPILRTPSPGVPLSLELSTIIEADSSGVSKHLHLLQPPGAGSSGSPSPTSPSGRSNAILDRLSDADTSLHVNPTELTKEVLDAMHATDAAQHWGTTSSAAPVIIDADSYDADNSFALDNVEPTLAALLSPNSLTRKQGKEISSQIPVRKASSPVTTPTTPRFPPSSPTTPNGMSFNGRIGSNPSSPSALPAVPTSTPAPKRTLLSASAVTPLPAIGFNPTASSSLSASTGKHFNATEGGRRHVPSPSLPSGVGLGIGIGKGKPPPRTSLRNFLLGVSKNGGTPGDGDTTISNDSGGVSMMSFATPTPITRTAIALASTSTSTATTSTSRAISATPLSKHSNLPRIALSLSSPPSPTRTQMQHANCGPVGRASLDSRPGAYTYVPKGSSALSSASTLGVGGSSTSDRERSALSSSTGSSVSTASSNSTGLPPQPQFVLSPAPSQGSLDSPQHTPQQQQQLASTTKSRWPWKPRNPGTNAGDHGFMTPRRPSLDIPRGGSASVGGMRRTSFEVQRRSPGSVSAAMGPAVPPPTPFSSRVVAVNSNANANDHRKRVSMLNNLSTAPPTSARPSPSPERSIFGVESAGASSASGLTMTSTATTPSPGTPVGAMDGRGEERERTSSLQTLADSGKDAVSEAASSFLDFSRDTSSTHLGVNGAGLTRSSSQGYKGDSASHNPSTAYNTANNSPSYTNSNSPEYTNNNSPSYTNNNSPQIPSSSYNASPSAASSISDYRSRKRSMSVQERGVDIEARSARTRVGRDRLAPGAIKTSNSNSSSNHSSSAHASHVNLANGHHVNSFTKSNLNGGVNSATNSEHGHAIQRPSTSMSLSDYTAGAGGGMFASKAFRAAGLLDRDSEREREREGDRERDRDRGADRFADRDRERGDRNFERERTAERERAMDRLGERERLLERDRAGERALERLRGDMEERERGLQTPVQEERGERNLHLQRTEWRRSRDRSGSVVLGPSPLSAGFSGGGNSASGHGRFSSVRAASEYAGPASGSTASGGYNGSPIVNGAGYGNGHPRAASRMAFSEAGFGGGRDVRDRDREKDGKRGSGSFSTSNGGGGGLMESPTFTTSSGSRDRDMWGRDRDRERDREWGQGRPADTPRSTVSGSTAATSVSGYLVRADREREREREDMIRDLRDKHSSEMAALLGALSDSQRTVRMLREENNDVRERVASLQAATNNNQLTDRKREEEKEKWEREIERRERECDMWRAECERWRADSERWKREWEEMRRVNEEMRKHMLGASGSMGTLDGHNVSNQPKLYPTDGWMMKTPMVKMSGGSLRYRGDAGAAVAGGDFLTVPGVNGHYSGSSMRSSRTATPSPPEEDADATPNGDDLLTEHMDLRRRPSRPTSTISSNSLSFSSAKGHSRRPSNSSSIFPVPPSNMSMLLNEDPGRGFDSGSSHKGSLGRRGMGLRNRENEADFDEVGRNGGAYELHGDQLYESGSFADGVEEESPYDDHDQHNWNRDSYFYEHDVSMTGTSVTEVVTVCGGEDKEREELGRSVNISPTTANFSIATSHGTGSPGSLFLKPEHEMLLGEMESLDLGAQWREDMEDGELLRFALRSGGLVSREGDSEW